MTESRSLLFAVLFITVFPIYLQAAISLPSYGNVIYVTKGSDVSLPWTYNFGGAAIILRQWFFSKTSRSSDLTPLIYFVGATKTICSKSRFKNIDVNEPATLVLKNVNLDHNGTYRFTVTVDGIATPPFSEIVVIILVQPTAVMNCSDPITLNEGDDLSCLCSHTGGNPPPTAVWSKGDSDLVTGYLKAHLVLKNVSNQNTGIYRWTVRSHNLQDDKSFKLVVQSKPIMKNFKSEPTIAILGKSLKITCEAEGFPEPNYIIRHNGSILAGVTDGMKTINPVQYSDAGSYGCTADNILGNSPGSFNLTVEVIDGKNNKWPTSYSRGGH